MKITRPYSSEVIDLLSDIANEQRARAYIRESVSPDLFADVYFRTDNGLLLTTLQTKFTWFASEDYDASKGFVDVNLCGVLQAGGAGYSLARTLVDRLGEFVDVWWCRVDSEVATQTPFDTFAKQRGLSVYHPRFHCIEDKHPQLEVLEPFGQSSSIFGWKEYDFKSADDAHVARVVIFPRSTEERLSLYLLKVFVDHRISPDESKKNAERFMREFEAVFPTAKCISKYLNEKKLISTG